MAQKKFLRFQHTHLKIILKNMPNFAHILQEKFFMITFKEEQNQLMHKSGFSLILLQGIYHTLIKLNYLNLQLLISRYRKSWKSIMIM